MRRRRAVLILGLSLGVLLFFGAAIPSALQEAIEHTGIYSGEPSLESSQALRDLDTLQVKGRAPKTGYSRDMFGGGWAEVSGCSTRDIILNRDLREVQLTDACTVQRGVLDDPYTGKEIAFDRSESARVQIDHVVALSDAWQKGAQQLTTEARRRLANDPLELLAVDGPANQQKGDGDAATWLPSNTAFRCEYVIRQIAVKVKYGLWVTQAEHDAMAGVLARCGT